MLLCYISPMFTITFGWGEMIVLENKLQSSVHCVATFQLLCSPYSVTLMGMTSV